MDMNNQEQLQELIVNLLQSQNEFIKGLGITGINTESTPFDDIWSDLIQAERKAKERTLKEFIRAVQEAKTPLLSDIEKMKFQLAKKDSTISEVSTN